MADVDATLDALFGEDLGAFVQARDEAAARLRAAGDREAAALVKAARKPSVPAWAINRLARDRPDEIAALFEVGARLRDAQRALLAGEADGEHTRAIAEEERAAVRALVERAAAILTDAGLHPSPAYRERIADTLFATASDDDVREAVARGRLTKESRRVGFGAAPDMKLIQGSRAEPAGAKQRVAEERRRRREQLAQKVKLLEHEAEEAARAAKEAERAHEEAGRAAARLRKTAEAAAQRLADARAKLDETDDERS